MHSRFLTGLIAATLLFAPFAASAQTTPDIKTQIAQLLAQIATLTQQLANVQIGSTASTTTPALPQGVPATAATSTTPHCPALSRNVSLGSSGNDVLGLQHFLSDEGLLDATALTGYFGPKTEAALKAWQSAQGVVSSGDATSSGWGLVGTKTRAAIAARCGGTLAMPGTIGASLGLSRAPAPLSVSAAVTVNTGNTCVAQTYSLDWGDGSAPVSIPVASGACAALSQTLAHTYATAGYYTVTVGSGSSRVSAHVQVEQAPTCASLSFAVNSVPGGAIGQSYSLPLISFPDSDTSLTLASTPLPDGLSLVDVQSTSTGQLIHTWTLAGTPTTATTTSITISAHNDCGTAQISFTLPVSQYSFPISSINSCPNYTFPACTSGAYVPASSDQNGCTVPAHYLCPAFTAVPTTGAAPLSVAFSGTGTSIAYGDGTFGPTVSGASTIGPVVHTYASAGTYTATSGGSSITITVTGSTVSSCTIIDCAIGYHASGPSCSANQTCVPD
jgi:PKD repeat protein